MSLNTPVALAFVDIAPVGGGVVTATTAAFTPSANALLIVKVVANNASAGVDPSVGSMSGGSLAYTRRARKNTNASSTGGAGQDGGAEIWTAPVGASPVSMTVAVTSATSFPGGANVLEYAVEVIEITDTSGVVPLIGNVGAASSASGVPSAAITGGVIAGSYGVAAASDWSAKATAGTTPAGQTIIRTGVRAGQVAWHFWRTTSTTSAGAQTMNLAGPAAQQYNAVALEVQTSAGGATPVTVTPSPSNVVFSSSASAQAATAVTPAAASTSFAATAAATAQTAVTPAAASAVFTSAATVTTAAPVDLGTVTAAAVFTAASLATAATAVVPAAATAVFASSGAVTASPVVAGSATAVFSSSAAAAAPTVVVPAAASSVYGASAVVTTPGSVTSSTRLPLAGVGN